MAIIIQHPCAALDMPKNKIGRRGAYPRNVMTLRKVRALAELKHMRLQKKQEELRIAQQSIISAKRWMEYSQFMTAKLRYELGDKNV